MLSGVNPGVRATLENAGICNLLGEENICPDIHAALERARVLGRPVRDGEVGRKKNYAIRFSSSEA